MKKIITALCLITGLLILSQSTRAQYTLKQANDQYKMFNYAKAIDLYLKTYKSKQNHFVEQHLATSYYMLRDYKNAEIWYTKIATSTENTPEDIYRYAEVLKNNVKYGDAKEQYIKYYALRLPVDTIQLNYWLSACDSAVKWMQNPGPYDIKNEVYLNSSKSDWGAVKFNNNLVFTSDRGNNNNSQKGNGPAPLIKFNGNKGPDRFVYGWTGNSYLHLFESVYSPSAENIVKLFAVDPGTDYHVGAASFTADGSEMFFTLTEVPKSWSKDRAEKSKNDDDEKTPINTIRLEIYSSKLDRSTGKWSKPTPFSYNNAKKWSVGDPFISADGQTLYFTSDMPGGFGGTDVYYCTRTAAGNWMSPTNLRSVNTIGNERTPVLDGNNFYFASDGQKGMGGLDIFKAVRISPAPNFMFSQPVNMGYPINSPMDDFAFNPSSATTGYFSSNRLGGAGSDDIYSYVLNPVLTYNLSGVVYDKQTHQIIANSTVTLNKVGGGSVSAKTDYNGKYNFPLTKQSNYRVRADKEGYLTDNKPVTTIGLSPPQSLIKNLYIDKIELNKAIRIENIYYDLDKSDIRPDAARELDKLVQVMTDNPTLIIELGSHTDSRGDDGYNMALSRRRAEAAVEYLVTEGGIDEGRILAHGYGETRLLNRCANGVKCSETDHQLNRRTEFTILKY